MGIERAGLGLDARLKSQYGSVRPVIRWTDALSGEIFASSFRISEFFQGHRRARRRLNTGCLSARWADKSVRNELLVVERYRDRAWGGDRVRV